MWCLLKAPDFLYLNSLEYLNKILLNLQHRQLNRCFGTTRSPLSRKHSNLLNTQLLARFTIHHQLLLARLAYSKVARNRHNLNIRTSLLSSRTIPTTSAHFLLHQKDSNFPFATLKLLSLPSTTFCLTAAQVTVRSFVNSSESNLILPSRFLNFSHYQQLSVFRQISSTLRSNFRFHSPPNKPITRKHGPQGTRPRFGCRRALSRSHHHASSTCLICPLLPVSRLSSQHPQEASRPCCQRPSRKAI